MKFIPILFSTLMVEAILDDRKTMTRRIVKPRPSNTGVAAFNDGEHPSMRCPYGKIGDVLWVREEHYMFGHWEHDNNPKTKRKTNRQSWKFVAENSEIRYNDNPPESFRKGRHHNDPLTNAWHKRLARFMPKTACRIFLQITDVRVERLNDITEQDAIAEGIISRCSATLPYILVYQKPNCPNYYYLAKEAFSSLWQSINGQDSWEENPFVWVISFQRIEKPENFK